MQNSRFPKDKKISPLRYPCSSGSVFLLPVQHSPSQVLFSFHCSVSWFENRTLFLIQELQSLSKYNNSWTKNREFILIWVTRHLGITVSCLAMSGCMAMISTYPIGFSTLDTKLFSDLIGLLKMSLMMLNVKNKQTHKNQPTNPQKPNQPNKNNKQTHPPTTQNKPKQYLDTRAQKKTNKQTKKA